MSDKFINGAGLGAIRTWVLEKLNALYPEIRTQGNWKYRIYSDGTFEAWYKQTGFSTLISYASGNLYRSDLLSVILPSDITGNYDCNILHSEVNCAHNNFPVWGMLASISDTGINYYAMSGAARAASPNYTLTSYVFGTAVAK